MKTIKNVLSKSTMSSELMNLVGKLDKQKQEKIEVLNAVEKNPYVLNYQILAITLGENLVHLSLSEVTDFYNMKDDEVRYVNKVDVLVAQVIRTLEVMTKENIQQQYNDNLTLDTSQPEFLFLVQKVEDVL